MLWCFHLLSYFCPHIYNWDVIYRYYQRVGLSTLELNLEGLIFQVETST